MTGVMSDPMTEASLFELLSLECRVDSYGSVYYYNALEQLHRVHGPAVEYLDGSKFWYQNGQRHRIDGPAVEYTNGGREWWQNGERHRLDGPAVEYLDGYRAWYANGRPLAEAEWLQAVASMGAV